MWGLGGSSGAPILIRARDQRMLLLVHDGRVDHRDSRVYYNIPAAGSTENELIEPPTNCPVRWPPIFIPEFSGIPMYSISAFATDDYCCNRS